MKSFDRALCAVAVGVGVLGLAACGSTASSSSSTSSDATPTSSSDSGLTAYVTNAQDNGNSPGIGTVIPVNIDAQSSGTPIQIGPGAGTNDIILSADGVTAYVTNEYTSTVTSVDLASGAVGNPIAVGSEPVAIAFVPGTNEQWAWVANYDGQSVSTINLDTGQTGQTIKVPNVGPNTVAFTPDGRTCYVANWGTTKKAGTTVTPIAVTDGGASGRVLPSITVGDNPNWVTISNDGATAYVANKGSNSISPIDVATNTAGKPITVSGPPIEMEIAPDGHIAYVAIAGSSPELDEVVPIDLTTNPVTVGPAIKLEPKSQPHWIAFAPDGRTAYVVGNGNGTLTPISVASSTAGKPIQVSTDPDSDLLAIVLR